MEHKRPKKIIEGFETDFDEINRGFNSYDTDQKLEHFLTFWKEKKIDLLFANRFDPRELLDSICELNRRLVSILVGDQDHDNQARLTALYFILCLYVKQPERFSQKIRLTINDVVKIQRFCEQETQSRSHSDALFAWTHLRQLEAIDFVEERLIYGPSMLSKRGFESADGTESLPTINDAYRESLRFIEERLDPAMAELQSINSNYEKVRELLDLNGVSDATVELESKGNVGELLREATDLIDEYKKGDDD